MDLMPYVNSSAIEWVDYDQHSKTMQIRFRGGHQTYSYYSVPKTIYEGLISAPSAGMFYDQHIKGRYS